MQFDEKKNRKKNHLPATHIDKDSFLSKLTRTFILFSAIVVLAVCGIFAMSNWLSKQEGIEINLNKTITSYMDEFEQEDYKNIDVKRALGEGGWLSVVDLDGNLIYSTKSVATSFTLGELDCIQRHGSVEELSVHRFSSASQESHILVTKTYTGEDGERIEEYMLFSDNKLGNNKRVLNGVWTGTGTKIGSDYYTEKEFEYLIYNAEHESSMFRLSFETESGKKLYAVYLDNRGENVTYLDLFLTIAIILTVVLYVVMAFVFLRYLNRNVQQPLTALRGAMTSFAKGGYRDRLQYKGSVEFEQLCSSFNEMVDLLNLSEQQRQKLEQDKRIMLAGLSHDLKTPITVIQGFSKALRDGMVTEEEKEKYLDVIFNKSEQMGELVEMFYEYSKLDHPDFSYSMHKLDIAELVRVSIASRYDEFAVRGYCLDMDITEQQLWCMADEKQICRVFANLIGNLFKYTPAGTTLFVEVGSDENSAIIHFADNGPGIGGKEGQEQDIFKPFVVGEESRNKQGSGLGLAVCQKIVQAHGGQIVVSEHPKEGYNLQFDITLPLCKEGGDEQ